MDTIVGDYLFCPVCKRAWAVHTYIDGIEHLAKVVYNLNKKVDENAIVAKAESKDR